jgi:hypothetical protein
MQPDYPQSQKEAGHSLLQLPAPFIYIGVILGNIFPLWGVLTQNWSLLDIFYLYWAENVIIGGFTVIRMLMAAAAFGLPSVLGSLFMIGFFTLHYGIFCMAHGMILFDLFGRNTIELSNEPILLLYYAFSSGTAEALPLALLGIFIAVGFESLAKLRQDRANAILPHTIMFSPYGRIIILHITIIFGGLLAQMLGAPIWALLLLIAIKVAYDLYIVSSTYKKQF